MATPRKPDFLSLRLLADAKSRPYLVRSYLRTSTMIYIYPTPATKPGQRLTAKFLGKKQTLVALKGGAFRPLLWRMVWDWVRG